MKRQRNPIKFKSEDEEFKFWSKANSVDYIDRSTLVKGRFPNLKLTSRPIPLRLPISLIDRLKVLAHKREVPYQSLMRQLIEEGLRKESFRHQHRAA